MRTERMEADARDSALGLGAATPASNQLQREFGIVVDEPTHVVLPQFRKLVRLHDVLTSTSRAGGGRFGG
jgi:hypothetical protein